MQVSYIDDEPCIRRRDGGYERIWFPDGTPIYYRTEELPDAAYNEATKESYRSMSENGHFRDGMPLLPPKREWCKWDF